MDAPYYSGSDERDELTEPDPAPCESCGANQDEPCLAECGCSACRRRDLLKQEREIA